MTASSIATLIPGPPTSRLLGWRGRFIKFLYELPWGSTVALSPYVTHRLPELYSEPQRFLPERWSRINPSVYEYVPFGAGPHMCLGTTFAMMEIKIVLAMLLQRY
jgi:cytochrome P450